MAHHREQDYQSLMLHTAAVDLMRQDAQLIERAQGILDRWMQATNIGKGFWNNVMRVPGRFMKCRMQSNKPWFAGLPASNTELSKNSGFLCASVI